jgi:RNA polymerase sigma factor (sigma-70 family)
MEEGSMSPVAKAERNLRTRPSLLLRIRDLGDQKSWQEFVELYGPVILRYLRKVGVPDHDAPDLAQDVLRSVVQHIGRFEYDAGRSFRAWLRTITTHRAFRYFAHEGRRPQTPGGTDHLRAIQEVPVVDDDQDALIETEWRTRCMELAMKQVRRQVTGPTWQAFELRYLDHLPPAAVAERLGLNIGAVYTSLSRVLKKLREAVEEIDGCASR